MDFGILGVSGDEENAGSGTIPRDLCGKRAAAHAGHHHVTDEEVDGGGVGGEEGERGFAGVGLDDLKSVGSLAAFVRVKRAGFKPSLNLLYALEGAILDCHWQEIPDGRRSELILEADAAVALLPQPKGRRVPVAGPVTTTRSDDDYVALPDSDPFEPEASASHGEE